MNEFADTFSEQSQNIVQKFLQSAVVVDDNPQFETSLAKKIPTPGRSQAKMDKATSSGTSLPSPLYFEPLRNAFADLQLICGLLRPADTEDINSEAKKLFDTIQCADLIILDWEIHHDSGKLCKEILRKAIDVEESAVKAHRVYCIYTGHFNDAVRHIKEDLEIKELKDPPTAAQAFFRQDGALFAVVNKINVEEKKLPNLLIELFTEEMTGLLPNVTLSALTAIRENSYRLLGRLSKKHDAAYIAHRVRNSPPEDAEEHILPLIVAEIESILADKAISEFVKYPAIFAWVENSFQGQVNKNKIRMKLVQEGYKIKSKKMDVFNSTYASLMKKVKENELSDIDNLINIFREDLDGHEVSEEEFAHLMQSRAYYEQPPRRLTLGTVVKESNGEYFLCLQPLCDTLRVPKEGKAFLFIKLKQSNNEKSDLLLKINENTLQSFQVQFGTDSIQSYTFEPVTPLTAITGTFEQGEWFFPPKESELKLYWVDELKPMIAQNISKRFFDQMSRIGVTESEWHRRKHFAPMK